MESPVLYGHAPRKLVLACAVLAGAFMLLYHHVLLQAGPRLGDRRELLAWISGRPHCRVSNLGASGEAERRRSFGRLTTGLLVVAASPVVLIAGVLGSELFLTRISMFGVLAGAVLFVAAGRLRVLLFPLGVPPDRRSRSRRSSSIRSRFLCSSSHPGSATRR